MSAAILQAQLIQVRARISEVLAAPKPSYSIDGKSVQWTDYLNMLLTQQDQLLRQIAMLTKGSSTPLVEELK